MLQPGQFPLCLFSRCKRVKALKVLRVTLHLPVAALVEVEKIAVTRQQPRKDTFAQLRWSIAILPRFRNNCAKATSCRSPADASIEQRNRKQTCFSYCCARASHRTS
jgi:hypothetical protein